MARRPAAGFVPEGRNTSGVVTLRLAGGDAATGQLEVVQATSLVDGWAAVCRTGFTRRMAMVGAWLLGECATTGCSPLALYNEAYICLPGDKGEAGYCAGSI